MFQQATAETIVGSEKRRYVVIISFSYNCLLALDLPYKVLRGHTFSVMNVDPRVQNVSGQVGLAPGIKLDGNS